MCVFQGLAVGDFCTCCHNCSEFLSVCVPTVSCGGYVSAECDFSFCEYCPVYGECEEIWGKEVAYETNEL